MYVDQPVFGDTTHTTSDERTIVGVLQKQFYEAIDQDTCELGKEMLN